MLSMLGERTPNNIFEGSFSSLWKHPSGQSSFNMGGLHSELCCSNWRVGQSQSITIGKPIGNQLESARKGHTRLPGPRIPSLAKGVKISQLLQEPPFGGVLSPPDLELAVTESPFHIRSHPLRARAAKACSTTATSLASQEAHWELTASICLPQSAGHHS